MRKQSDANSSSPPKLFTLFLDRNLGKHAVADALEKAGILVEVHDDHLPKTAPDDEWLAFVAKRNCVAITKDAKIRYRFPEIQAVKAHKAMMMVVVPKNITGKGMADVLIKAHDRIQRFPKRNKPPFIAGIYADGSVKAYEI
ncbi:MAG: DUF5615 family PIN-like protein [Arenicellales bacterium]